jgi:hypothetical protein
MLLQSLRTSAPSKGSVHCSIDLTFSSHSAQARVAVYGGRPLAKMIFAPQKTDTGSKIACAT